MPANVRKWWFSAWQLSDRCTRKQPFVMLHLKCAGTSSLRQSALISAG